MKTYEFLFADDLWSSASIEDASGFLEEGKLPPDGTLFGWDRKKRFRMPTLGRYY